MSDDLDRDIKLISSSCNYVEKQKSNKNVVFEEILKSVRAASGTRSEYRLCRASKFRGKKFKSIYRKPKSPGNDDATVRLAKICISLYASR
jgi:hypothetical protein